MKKLLFLIFPLALLTAVVGIYCGIIRVGQPLPSGNLLPVAHHGVLMCGPFIGTLICLERTISFQDKKAWFISFLMVLSFPLLVFSELKYALACLITGSVGYVIITVLIYLKHKQRGNLMMVSGAVFQLLAYIVFSATYSYPNAFAGWMLFLILTIVGERLNLGVLRTISDKRIYELYTWTCLLLLSSFLYHFGLKLIMGLSLAGLAQWLLRHDIKRSQLKETGYGNFLTLSLSLSYLWLMVTGFLGMSEVNNPYLYDAVLHTFFVGFVLSMILAHAPEVFPMLVNIKNISFHPVMYLWLAGLHSSLFIRIYGDLTEDFALRKFGGIYNGIFFTIYILTVIFLLCFKKNNPQVSKKKLHQ